MAQVTASNIRIQRRANCVIVMEVPDSPLKPTPGPSAGSGQALNGPSSLRNKVEQRRIQKLKRFSVVSPTLSKIRKEWGSHFWGEGERIKSKGGPAPLDNSGIILARYTRTENEDEPLSEIRASTNSYYAQDGINAVTSLTDITGSIGKSYVYDSFGKLLSSSGTLTNPFQYTGREFDNEDALYFYRARYYDSTSGRFLNEDPLAFFAGTNFYRYVYNDPISFTDPSGKNGLMALPWLGGTTVGEGVAGAVVGIAEGGAVGLAGLGAWAI